MVALITGITGQDGSYLAELLISKGYEVHGLIPIFFCPLVQYSGFLFAPEKHNFLSFPAQ